MLGFGGTQRARPTVTDLFNGFNTDGTYTGSAQTVADHLGVDHPSPANMLPIQGGRLSYDVSEGATLGPELAVGGFGISAGWTLGTGWSIVDGKGVASNATTYSYKTFSGIALNRKYRCTVEISGYVTGNAAITFLGVTSPYEGVYRKGNGAFSEVFTPLTGTPNQRIGIQVQSGFTGTVESFSVREIIPAWVITSRETAWSNAVAIGDSITFASQGWSQRINQTVDYASIVNKGVSGNKLADMWARWNADVLALNPDLVVVFGGVNDLLTANSNPVAAMQSILTGMVESLNTNGITPIIGTIPPCENAAGWTAARQGDLNEYNTWLKGYCEAEVGLLRDTHRESTCGPFRHFPCPEQTVSIQANTTAPKPEFLLGKGEYDDGKLCSPERKLPYGFRQNLNGTQVPHHPPAKLSLLFPILVSEHEKRAHDASSKRY